MLHIVFGGDYTKVRKEAESILKSFKKDDISVEYHTAETINPKDLAYRSESTSLFGGIFIYVVDGFIDQYADEAINIFKKLANSSHLFILCEDDIVKDIEKSAVSAGGKVASIKSEKKETNNPFAITDALLSKDKKKTWQLYRREVESGESPEAIMGRFAWAMKTLVLIQNNSSAGAAELGISPFVYSKTKSISKNWKIGESENFYTNMLFGMKADDETEYHLEKMILSM